MANEPILTVIGNLTADPELRFTPSGSAVANFTIAQTPKTFDRNSNEWVEGEAVFMRCSIWREAAENVAESLSKGMRVIGVGKLKSKSYDAKEGGRRTVLEMELDAIGPDLRFATAKVERSARGNGEGAAARGGYGGNSGGSSGGVGGAWSNPAAGSASGWGNGGDAPF